MSDYSELKKLAEAALANWPDSKLFERPECERFIDASRPDVVLALIAENEALRKDAERYRGLCDLACDVTFWAGGSPIKGCVEIEPDQYHVAKWGNMKDELDALIDAAMGKEAKS